MFDKRHFSFRSCTKQEHYPPGGPQDGLSGWTDDDLANLDQELPTSDDLTAGEIFLEHSFVKKEHTVKQGKDKGGKKVFVSLVVGPYIFKRRQNPKEDGLVTFSCNGCFSLGETVLAYAWKTVDSDDPMKVKPFIKIINQ